MTVLERVKVFNDLFDKLQSTNSRNEKEYYVNNFLEKYPELSTDWTYILKTLSGKHPIGFTFESSDDKGCPECYNSISKWINRCERVSPKTNCNIRYVERLIGNHLGKFLEPIVNRTLRLGIGNSLLDVNKFSPMLAKKFEPNKAGVFKYIITEKLNGNRCIAYYLDGKWHFISRSGKPLKVNIDMTRMPTEYIYDGELLSYDQTQQSIRRTIEIQMKSNLTYMNSFDSAKEFCKTTGMVNDKNTNHPLVYNVFDIISSTMIAKDRKKILTEIEKDIVYAYAQVRMLPILYEGNDVNIIDKLLNDITFSGGEGLMLNNPYRSYIQSRTDSLLKYKKVKTMDMYVLDVYEGTGKYEGMVGSLYCYMVTDDGKKISCNVGTGLSDDQRLDWKLHRENIVGKVVEVGYQSISQSKDSSKDSYSLQFPRLLRVRTDKNKPSEY